MRIDKKATYSKEYEIKTAGKNNWILFMHEGRRKNIPERKASVFCVVYYYSDKGLMVFYRAAGELLAGFTLHFLKNIMSGVA